MGDLQAKQTRKSSLLRLWLPAFLVLFVARLFLPFQPNESMGLYNSMAWALVHEQNWSKQAIVGILEFSPIPVVLLLLTWPLSLIPRIPVSGAELVVAASQALFLLVLIRTLYIVTRRPLLSTFVGLLAIGLVGVGADGNWWPFRYLLVSDPFWPCMLPAVAAFLYLTKWDLNGRLRDLMLFALLSGVLVFCGPAGICIGIAMVFAVLIYGRKRLAENGATPFFLLLPLLYALFLQFLFNLLVMSDAFFAIRRLAAYMVDWQRRIPGWEDWRIYLVATWLPVLLLVLVLPRLPLRLRAAWFAMIALVPVYALRRFTGLFIGGELLLGAVVLYAILTAGFDWKHWTGGLPKKAIASLISLIFILSIFMYGRGATAREQVATSDQPTRQQIVDYIDPHWKDSRILIFGIRASSLYCCTDEDDPAKRDRFIGRIDLNLNVLRERIQEEQLHLLVPPNNGKFYPRDESFFSELHASADPSWLFLETTWGHGDPADRWQLWRCIRKKPHKGNLE